MQSSEDEPYAGEYAGAPPKKEESEILHHPKEWSTRNISEIRNKIRRHHEFITIKRQKKKDKRRRQDERKKLAESLGKAAPAKLKPKTIESMREYDETTVIIPSDKRSVLENCDFDEDEKKFDEEEIKLDGKENKSVVQEEDDEETTWDIKNDEFSQYFAKSYVPKVLITSSDNPHSKTISFMKELSRVIPNSEPLWRRKMSIKKISKDARERQISDIIIINEDNRNPNGLVLSHLPDGPTAHFRLSNVKIARDLKKNWRDISAHRPEVVMNNFTTRLGHTVARMLAACFHYEPHFVGRRSVTFHNQRDYIFFRHHTYYFKSSERVRLREMGPRFTLKLRSLQKGCFDSVAGEYDWIITNKRHNMETSRRKFFL